jgi:hypothetical protein
MWWMLACVAGTSGLETPLSLEGDGVVAHITEERGWRDSQVRIGLWGESFGTVGDVRAAVVDDPDGSIWLHFAVETGLGDAIAALRIQGDTAILPLGSRPGEFEIHLKKTVLEQEELESRSNASRTYLQAEQKEWREGSFLLMSKDGPAGEIRFRGDLGPMVSVHDAWWLTPRPVEATLETQGAELLVAFAVEPSLKGENALMRVNVPLRTVVVPLGPVPVPEERSFRLQAGSLTEVDRRLAIESSVQKSEALETSFIEELAPRLSAAAKTDQGGCTQLPELSEEWSMMLEGYDIQLTPTPEGCSVGIEPSQAQHGRRYKGVIQP